MKVYIKETAYEIVQDSIDISLALEERSTASFVVRDKGKHVMIRKGEKVEIYHNGSLLFGGVVETVKKIPITVEGGFYFSVSCVDYHYFADKRIIVLASKNTTSGAIVQEIYDKYLKAEGITIGAIAQGDFVEESIFNYISASEAITKLTNYANNYTWYIDNQKRLFYIEKGTVSAPFKITPDVARVSNTNYEESAAMYRNKQYITGAKDVTSEQSEIKLGNGVERVFITRYPLNQKPQIFISYNGSDWIEKTVGINGLDDNKDFYWNKGSNEITQGERITLTNEEGEEVDQEIEPLTENDRLRIVYRGQFDTVIISMLPYEIARTGEVEGSSGLVESLEEVTGFSARSDTLRYANALLNKYGEISRSIVFETSRSGLAVGQSIKVTLPIYELDDEEMIIGSIDISTEALEPLYKITAVKGPLHGSWESMFNNISGIGDHSNKDDLRTAEQVMIPLEFEKHWTEQEEPNIFRRNSNLSTFVGFYAGLTYENRVKYMSWFRNGVELGRVPATQVTDYRSDVINTLFHLQPGQANTTFDELVWWGGMSATEELGTGFIIDRKPVNIKKQNIEMYQITRFDYKWTYQK